MSTRLSYLAALAIALRSIVHAAPAPSCTAPAFPVATVDVYDDTNCGMKTNEYVLKAGTCSDDPSTLSGLGSFASVAAILSKAVPVGYECKLILYSGLDCAGAGTATAKLVKGENTCQPKEYSSSASETELGGQSIGYGCAQLAASPLNNERQLWA